MTTAKIIKQEGQTMKIPFTSGKCKVTSPYGERTLSGKTQFHSGYDLVPAGAWDICAVEDGTVVSSRIVTDKKNLTWQWGNYVCIKTASGQYHYYCHMASRAVTKGQTVKKGDKIGVMGNTGYSFGAHPHFEVRAGDGKTTLNPETVLRIPNRSGAQIYEATEDTGSSAVLEKDLETLVKHGVINTPSYWQKNAGNVKFLPELIHNMAVKLGGK